MGKVEFGAAELQQAQALFLSFNSYRCSLPADVISDDWDARAATEVEVRLPIKWTAQGCHASSAALHRLSTAPICALRTYASAPRRQPASQRTPSPGGEPLHTPFFHKRALCTHMRVCPKPAWPPAPPRCSTQVSDACRAVLLMTKRDLYDLCFEGFVDVEDRQNRPELVSLLQVGISM